MLKKIHVEQAVGMTLGHDMTRVIPGKCKEVAFRRGHVIVREDIPELLKIGKEHIYIIEGQDSKIKEQLLDHPSCSWKIDTFLKSAGIRKLAKGQDFEFDEDSADDKDVPWINPMGLRCIAHVIVDESYVSAITKQVVPKNRVSVFYTDRPALPPDPKYRVMKTTK